MQVKKQQFEPDMEQQTASRLGKEYVKAVLLSPCLFNLYAEYIMRNAGLDEAQAGIKIAGRNINKSRDFILPTKVHLVKAMVFPVVMYGCESWTIKKAECIRIDALNFGVWEDSWESLGLQADPTGLS